MDRQHRLRQARADTVGRLQQLEQGPLVVVFPLPVGRTFEDLDKRLRAEGFAVGRGLLPGTFRVGCAGQIPDAELRRFVAVFATLV